MRADATYFNKSQRRALKVRQTTTNIAEIFMLRARKAGAEPWCLSSANLNFAPPLKTSTRAGLVWNINPRDNIMKDTGGRTLGRSPAWLRKRVSSPSRVPKGRPPNKSNHFIRTHPSEKYRRASRTKTPHRWVSCCVLLKRLATWTTVLHVKDKRHRRRERI